MKSVSVSVSAKMPTADAVTCEAHHLTLPALLGRGDDCALHLDSTLVSRHHARISWDDDSHRLCVNDEGSANGTFLNGKAISSAPFSDEDCLEIGQFFIELVDQPCQQIPEASPPDTSDPALLICTLVRQRIQDDPQGLQEDAEAVLSTWVSEAIADQDQSTCNIADDPELHAHVMALLTGYGPIQSLILDTDINEIMVNGPQRIFVERLGHMEETNLRFSSSDELRTIIERIVTPLGRRIDDSSPTVDARLPDGSRVHAVIPPVAIDGPILTIRKFRQQQLTLESLVQSGSLSQDMATLLKQAVLMKCNIIVSGGTGSGKTTLLNILSSFIPENERIVTIEDSAELQLAQRHVVRLETRPANAEGAGSVSIRDLVRNALRMRPDRIVVGECRGPEALDMLQAMNTGHDGSLTTVHANSPRDAVARIETMGLMADLGLPHRAIREQAVRAIDLLVQQSRLPDGSRRITEIAELQRLEGDVPVLQTLFCFERHRQVFVASGFSANCLQDDV